MAEDVNKPKGQASDKTHERIDRAADRVKQQADKAAEATREKAGRAEQRVDQAADAGAQSAHRAADHAADWRERGGAVQQNLRDKAENLYGCACDYVREKPLQSVAIAIAAGWVIGRLMSSRH